MIPVCNRRSIAPITALIVVAMLFPWAGPGGKLPSIAGAMAAALVDLKQRLRNRCRFDPASCFLSADAGGEIWQWPVWLVFAVLGAVYTFVALAGGRP